MSFWRNVVEISRTTLVRWMCFGAVLYGIQYLLITLGAGGPARQAAQPRNEMIYGIVATFLGTIGLVMALPYRRKRVSNPHKMHGVIDATDRDEMAQAIWSRAGENASKRASR